MRVSPSLGRLVPTAGILLVAAFVGMERMRAIYTHAVAQEYRFFSYGDAMFIE